MNAPRTLENKLRDRRLVFCGIGAVFESIVRELAGVDYRIAGLLDNDAAKQGTLAHGVPIRAFPDVRGMDYDYLVLSTPFYADIEKQLLALDVPKEKLIPLGASYNFGCSLSATHAAQQQLQNRDFTMVADDCWGGLLYAWLGVPFQTPFINLIVPPHDFLKLSANIDYFLLQELLFRPEDRAAPFPVGSLADVKLHFIHERTEPEAKKNWERRLQRIHSRNMFFKFETDDASLVQAFGDLPLPRKIVFTRNTSANGAAVLHLKDENVGGSRLQKTCLTCRNHVDLVRWLNTGRISPPSERE